MEEIIIPSLTEIKLLGKVIFSCKNHKEGCNEEFNLDSLEQLLLHQKSCVIKESQNKIEKCKRCNSLLGNYLIHECMIKKDSKYSKLLKCNYPLKNEKVKFVDNALIKHTIAFESKLDQF